MMKGWIVETSDARQRLGVIFAASLCYAASAARAGDVNCDGSVNVGDIAPMVLSLTDPQEFAGQYPTCDPMNGDCNSDFAVNGMDVTCFVTELLEGDGCACPSDVFLDVSQAPGAGAGYPRPQLSASCTETTLVVTSNGIPHYTFIPITPGALTAQNYRWTVPLCPEPAAQTTTIPLLGTIGFAVNGLPIFGPNEAGMPADQAYGDPIYNGIMDPALGHVGGPGQYHYHALLQNVLVPSGLVAEPWLNDDPDPNVASPIIAFALDGFPIYGPYCCADAACSRVIEMQSSWVQVGNPRTNAWSAYQYQEQAGEQYLDRCNGHVGSKGVYHYHATSRFPYTLGCYRGTRL